MLSTTIRYSTLPENSHSISLTPAHPPHHDPTHEPALPVVHFYEADPDTPGAYRYDPSDPTSYDLSVPDSDPRSPRYEPPHLRHQPGDTWEIGGKPYDPLDPGPYGTPGWYQDQRTGRHRRGELPDPLPSGESEQRPAPIPSPSPPVDTSRPPRPYRPHRRYRRWEDPEYGTETNPRDIRGDDAPYRFSPLREGAMQRFLELSQPFRDAHFQPQAPSFGERLVLVLRWLMWVAACGLPPAPRPLGAEHERAPDASTAVIPDTSYLTEIPRQERPRTASAVQPSYMAVWEGRFDAQAPVHRSASFSVAGGGVL